MGMGYIMTCARKPCIQQGMTLVELLVTMAILGILLGLAIPNFQSVIAANALRTATNDLMAGIAQTRALAIRTGKRATMCPSLSGTYCDQSATWQDGWIIFSDPSKRGGALAATDAAVITAYHPSLASSIIVVSNDGIPGYISYGGDGQGKKINGEVMAGTLRVCTTASAVLDAERARNLVMNFVGRISNRKISTDASCNARMAA